LQKRRLERRLVGRRKTAIVVVGMRVGGDKARPEIAMGRSLDPAARKDAMA
jgi:hypothetical protein